VLCLGNCRTMWEVTDENRRLLSSWAASCDDPKRHLLADSIVKNSSPAVDFDEVNRVLREFSADYPIYQFVDGLRPFRPKSEEKRDPAYEARIERLKREQEDRIYKQMTRSVDPNQQYGRVNLMQNFAELRKCGLQTGRRSLLPIRLSLLVAPLDSAFLVWGMRIRI
uniref:Transmembrane protein 199 n=1 Tax=Parascaris univalens TaxID=6257 RepID=A0A915B8W4_PARUN